MSRRSRQVASAIRDELVQITQRELNDPRLKAVGMITFSGVELSPDHKNANVFVSFMGQPKDSPQVKAALQALESAAGLFRRLLLKRLATKAVPQLRFRYDDLFDKAAEVGVALKSAADFEAALAAEKAAANPAKKSSDEEE